MTVKKQIDRLLDVLNNEFSLCKLCGYKTKTLVVKRLSASENDHYGYYCEKCKIAKV